MMSRSRTARRFPRPRYDTLSLEGFVDRSTARNARRHCLFERRHIRAMRGESRIRGARRRPGFSRRRARPAWGLPRPGALSFSPRSNPRTTQELNCHTEILWSADLIRRLAMKWAGMYLVGFVLLVGGILAALWKLGLLADVSTTWASIGVLILIGIGIMISVAHSGTKENIQIDRK